MSTLVLTGFPQTKETLPAALKPMDTHAETGTVCTHTYTLLYPVNITQQTPAQIYQNKQREREREGPEETPDRQPADNKLDTRHARAVLNYTAAAGNYELIARMEQLQHKSRGHRFENLESTPRLAATTTLGRNQ